MTLVQNLLQRLNGSKTTGIFAFIAFFFGSCGLLKGTTNNPEIPDVPVIVKKQETVKVIETKPVHPSAAVEYVNFQGDQYEVSTNRKKDFKIALILPFNLKSDNLDEKRLSDIMLDYYQGFKIALNELEPDGFKIKVHVYDSENDSLAIVRLLQKTEMKQMDVIIGPITDKYMNMVSSFGLKNNIPVFSPFTPVDKLNLSNQLFYNFNLDHKSKATQMVAFIKRYYPTSKVFIVRDGNKYDKEFVPIFISELEKQKISFEKVVFSNFNNWGNLLSKENEIIYIPTSTKNVVSVTLGNVFASKKKVNVIGEYKWVDFNNNDYKFWENLNVHLVCNSFLDYNDTLGFGFRENYRADYRVDPGEYAYLGYSQGKFLGEALLAFGDYFPTFINNKNLIYTGTCYNFVERSGVKCNRHMWVLKYENHRLTPVEY